MKIRRGLLKGLVRVLDDDGAGMGFACQIGPFSSFITAAHCVPLVDPTLVEKDPGLSGLHALGSTKVCAEAMVRFVDPCADVAVLSDANWQRNLYDLNFHLEEAYGQFRSKCKPLTINLTIPDSTAPRPVHIYTHDRKWVTGMALFQSPLHPFTALSTSDEIHPGTSGAPVFDDDGLVIGVVSAGFLESGVRMALLANALPNWAIRALTIPAADLFGRSVETMQATIKTAMTNTSGSPKAHKRK